MPNSKDSFQDEEKRFKALLANDIRCFYGLEITKHGKAQWVNVGNDKCYLLIAFDGSKLASMILEHEDTCDWILKCVAGYVYIGGESSVPSALDLASSYMGIDPRPDIKPDKPKQYAY